MSEHCQSFCLKWTNPKGHDTCFKLQTKIRRVYTVDWKSVMFVYLHVLPICMSRIHVYVKRYEMACFRWKRKGVSVSEKRNLLICLWLRTTTWCLLKPLTLTGSHKEVPSSGIGGEELVSGEQVATQADLCNSEAEGEGREGPIVCQDFRFTCKILWWSSDQVLSLICYHSSFTCEFAGKIFAFLGIY